MPPEQKHAWCNYGIWPVEGDARECPQFEPNYAETTAEAEARAAYVAKRRVVV